MRTIVIVLVLMGNCQMYGQELFVVTDPASNVPANSLSVNVMNSFFDEKYENGLNYHLMPELTYGLSKSMMLRLSTFVSDRSNKLYGEGAAVMGKYRFLSRDDLNAHFRMALYGRYSLNRSNVHQEQIEIMGHNSGYEVGIIATKLLHKLAISATASYEKAMNNALDNEFPKWYGSNASNYTFSIGRLMYPKVYKTTKQTNVNLMLELIGQSINSNGSNFCDVTPAIQFIIRSQGRIDIAYRYELWSTMYRSAPNGLYLNFYYTFFNVNGK